MSERLSGEALLDALESGTVRAAERGDDGRWRANAWVKEEILALFRSAPVAGQWVEWLDPELPRDPRFTYCDKESLTVRRFAPEDGVRLVPGGSAVRRGSHLGAGVVCMPPMYVNVGAFVGAGTMIDSHALVGSCAQVGERVHVSAAVQIGGVLEPASARPVVVEDDAFLGGGCGVYEGVLVGERAVLSAGVVLTQSTRVFDLVHERDLSGTAAEPLEIPPDAVVVPGTRPAGGTFAELVGLHVSCALIVKYRDASTDAATALEEALR